MACKYICDGCGKEMDAYVKKQGIKVYNKPNSWFQRQDEDGIQDACSRKCIEKIARESGKTNVVLPF